MGTRCYECAGHGCVVCGVCSACHGDGVIIRELDDNLIEVDCDECAGTGHRMSLNDAWLERLHRKLETVVASTVEGSDAFKAATEALDELRRGPHT